MAATANSIKKSMDLVREPDGKVIMTIRIVKMPNRMVYVDGRPCGYFSTGPMEATQGVNETVVATVTEFVKEVERRG